MSRITVNIEALDHEDAALALDTSDTRTALLIADINIDKGAAEIWDGERRLARLRKRGGDHASFWEVGSG